MWSAHSAIPSTCSATETTLGRHVVGLGVGRQPVLCGDPTQGRRQCRCRCWYSWRCRVIKGDMHAWRAASGIADGAPLHQYRPPRFLRCRRCELVSMFLKFAKPRGMLAPAGWGTAGVTIASTVAWIAHQGLAWKVAFGQQETRQRCVHRGRRLLHACCPRPLARSQRHISEVREVLA
jgi:hypothetical protein